MRQKSSPASNRETLINVLRGIAALAVLLSHSDHAHLIYFDGLTSIKDPLGQFGVYLFFILSGYLIWTSARRLLPTPNGLAIYAVNRLTRIMPLYYISIFLALVVVPMIGSDFKSTADEIGLLRHLVFTQALLPSLRNINPVLWTLTHAAIFYVLVPLLVLARQRAPLPVLLGGLVVIGLPWIAPLTGPLAPFAQLAYLFAIGIAIAEYLTDQARMRHALVILVATAVVTGIGLPRGYCLALGAASLLVGCLALATYRHDKVAAVLTTAARPLALIGIGSYSLYIWHYLVLNIISNHLQETRIAVHDTPYDWITEDGLARGIIVSALMLIVTTLSYLAFEKPFMTHVRRYLVGRLNDAAGTEPGATRGAASR